MIEKESTFPRIDKKPFERAGFQDDDTYIQEISRKTPNKKGEKEWIPPRKGQKIITRQGPLKVNKIIETFEFKGNKYFRAKGELLNQR
jgi:hypothetical protein